MTKDEAVAEARRIAYASVLGGDVELDPKFDAKVAEVLDAYAVSALAELLALSEVFVALRSVSDGYTYNANELLAVFSGRENAERCAAHVNEQIAAAGLRAHAGHDEAIVEAYPLDPNPTTVEWK